MQTIMTVSCSKIPLDLFINGIRSSIDPLSTSITDFCPELCVKYLVDGQALWDNNKGKNYLFTLTKGSKLKPALNELPETARTKQEAHEKEAQVFVLLFKENKL